MITNNDNDLLVMLKEGSLEAYGIVFKKYYSLLCIQAATILKDNAQAEDLTEDFFVYFWEKKIYLQIECSLKAYLCSSIRNRCLNELNKGRVMQVKLEEYKYYLEKRTEAIPIDNDNRHRLNKVLLDFPSQRLKAITLVYLEHKKYREAAQEMGVSINSVKTHLKRGLQVLRKQLTNE